MLHCYYVKNLYFRSRLQSDLLKRDVNKPEPAKTETTKPDTNHNSFLFESSDDELSPEEEAAVSSIIKDG